MKTLILLLAIFGSISTVWATERFEACSQINSKKFPEEYRACLRSEIVKKPTAPCSEINKKKYPEEYKHCLKFEKRKDELDRFSQCTKVTGKSISCREGTYEFVSSEAGKQIKEVLGRDGKAKKLDIKLFEREVAPQKGLTK